MRRRRLVFSDPSIADSTEQAEWYATSRDTTELNAGRNLSRQHFARTDPTRDWRGLQIAIASTSRRKTATISGFPKHLLFYRFDDDEVFVLRVVHGARDLERLFS